MGLLRRHLNLLAIEHKKHPITGEVLTLGQQSVHTTLNEVKNIFKKQGVTLENLPLDFNTRNKIPDWKGTKYDDYTNCQATLSLLGAKKVIAADVSGYENPDIIMDFNLPVDKKYYNAFDAIVDIGTLEHIFNISQALENINLMCKPGGTIVLGTWTSNDINHGFYQICPTLFYDYFSMNGFENFDCFILVGSNLNYEKKAKIWQCNNRAMVESMILNSKKGVETMFFATKKSSADNEQKKYPIQSYYTASDYWNKKTDSKAKKPLLKFIFWILFSTRRYRPEFIDMIWKERKTKKNLRYIGRY